MTSRRFVIADVFTATRFTGNQLAVYTDAQGLDSGTMQEIAREMNYSETTFLLPPESEGDFRVRIFTPGKELPFAGHPIVGTSFVIVSEELKPANGNLTSVKLETRVGIIDVEVATLSGRPGRTTMSQPLPKVVTVYSDTSRLAGALGVNANEIEGAELPVEVIYNGLTVMMIPAKSIDTVRRIRPKTSELEDIVKSVNAETVMIFTTETEHPTSNSHSRVFAPGAGVGEDPATGSANGPLGFYLARHGLVSATNNRFSIVNEQGFEMKRPSLIYIDIVLEPDGKEVNKVLVAGDVVISGKGEIFLD